jgi:hypothetical protein
MHCKIYTFKWKNLRLDIIWTFEMPLEDEVRDKF